MGKNAGFKAAKAARYGSATGGGGGGGGDGEDEYRPGQSTDGMADVTYHTPAWHQARIEALMRPRMSYEEWKLKAKEAEGKLASVAEQEEALMREYKAQLEADRAARMGKPAVAAAAVKDKKHKKKSKKKHSSSKEKDRKKKKKKHGSSKKDRKEKDHKDKEKKRKRSRDTSSGSSSGSDVGSDSDSGSSSDSSAEGQDVKRKRGEDDPVRLSEFFKS